MIFDLDTFSKMSLTMNSTTETDAEPGSIKIINSEYDEKTLNTFIEIMNFFNPLKDLFTGDLREFFTKPSSFGRRLFKYDGATEMIRTMLWRVWKHSSHGNRTIDKNVIDNEIKDFLRTDTYKSEVGQASPDELKIFYEHVKDFINRANKELYSGFTGFFLNPLKMLRNLKRSPKRDRAIQVN